MEGEKLRLEVIKFLIGKNVAIHQTATLLQQ